MFLPGFEPLSYVAADLEFPPILNESIMMGSGHLGASLNQGLSLGLSLGLGLNLVEVNLLRSRPKKKFRRKKFLKIFLILDKKF